MTPKVACHDKLLSLPYRLSVLWILVQFSCLTPTVAAFQLLGNRTGTQSSLQNRQILQLARDGPKVVGKISLFYEMKTIYVDFHFIGMKLRT